MSDDSLINLVSFTSPFSSERKLARRTIGNKEFV